MEFVMIKILYGSNQIVIRHIWMIMTPSTLSKNSKHSPTMECRSRVKYTLLITRLGVVLMSLCVQYLYVITNEKIYLQETDLILKYFMNLNYRNKKQNSLLQRLRNDLD